MGNSGNCMPRIVVGEVKHVRRTAQLTKARIDERRRTRSGFALDELLAVLLLMVLVVGALVMAGRVVIQVSDDVEGVAARPAARRMANVIVDCAVPLGNGFVCTVRLVEQDSINSQHPPEYGSRVRVARREFRPSDRFLLEISKSEHPARENRATIRTWKLMSQQAAEDYLDSRRQAAARALTLPEEQRFADVTVFFPPDVESIGSIDEPLLLLVPPHLQETGMLLSDPSEPASVIDFPLERLAASIRSAMRNDHWEPGDLHALLRRYDSGNRRLSEDDERAIARLVVRRLLDDLPQ